MKWLRRLTVLAAAAAVVRWCPYGWPAVLVAGLVAVCAYGWTWLTGRPARRPSVRQPSERERVLPSGRQPLAVHPPDGPSCAGGCGRPASMLSGGRPVCVSCSVRLVMASRPPDLPAGETAGAVDMSDFEERLGEAEDE